MKYVGSKLRVFPKIKDIVTEHLSDDMFYIEPFCGGCNSIAQVEWANRIANDVNQYVIDMFIGLVNGWTPPVIDKQTYNDIKANKGEYDSALVGWCGIALSYSGKWFGGFAGKVETKEGIRDYQAEAHRNLKKQLPALMGIRFTSHSYYNLSVGNDNVVYLDPPYANTTGYANHAPFNPDLFWDYARNISQNNFVYISEYQAPSDFDCIWQQSVGSSLSANGKVGGRKQSTEKLFVYRKGMSARLSPNNFIKS